jgi:uncharacterized membrane protein
VTTGGNATGELTITVPANTPSGTDVTVTIEAVAPGASDSNYAVLRLSVVTKVTSDIYIDIADMLESGGIDKDTLET